MIEAFGLDAALVGLGLPGDRRDLDRRRDRRPLLARLAHARLPARLRGGSRVRRVRPVGGRASSTSRCSAAARAELLQNGDRFYPGDAGGDPAGEGHDQLRGLHLRVGRDRAGRSSRRSRSGRGPGVEVRLLLDWFGSIRLKRAHRRRAAGGRRQAGVLPSARASEPGADVPAHPPTRDRDRRPDRVHRRRGRSRTSGRATRARPKEWRDSMTRVTGPLVVGVQSAFAANWVYVLRRGDRGPAVLSADRRRPARPAACRS